MVTTIFLLLNGLGVAFLLYVLANFWKEGHRPKSQAQTYTMEFGQRDWTKVLVVTHPLSRAAQSGPSVIPFRARGQASANLAQGTASTEARETAVR